MTLQLSLDGDYLLIGVCDGSAVVPRARGTSATDEDGRGLAIVGALSHDWGVDTLPGGHKRVWARVPVRKP